MRPTLFVFLVVLPFTVARPQVPAPRSLQPPTAMSRVRFSEVRDVVELGNGKVLVTDPTERTLTILDMTTGRGQAISSIGSGPREYRGIGNLIARPDGGAMLVDFAQFRFLPIGPDGAVADVVKYPIELGRTVSATDAQGRYYSDAYPPRAATGVRSDSMWIVRWDPRRSGVDTLIKYDAGISKWTGPVDAPMPVFPPIDDWAVLSGGQIVIAEAATYRISFWDGARMVRSVDVPWQPVRFTAADRQAHQEYAAANPPIPMGQGGGAAKPPPMTFTYPVSLPAFVRGQTWVDRQGRLWIEKSRSAGDPVPMFDVLDGNGQLLGKVALPARGLLAGFGPAAVYVAMPNDDDELVVQRHSLPALPSR